MSTIRTIDDLIYELEEIRSREGGGLPVTWGDGYFYETPINLIILEGRTMRSPYLPKRICFSKEWNDWIWNF